MPWFVLIIIVLLATGCKRSEEEKAGGMSLDEFIPQYNQYVRKWLIAELEDARKAEDKDLIARYERRLEFGGYFKFSTSEELPEDLSWKDGLDQPEMGDPMAKKGGMWRFPLPNFPPTLRRAGPRENHSFRGGLYEHVSLALVEMHRETGAAIPGVAKQWASGPELRTWYFRLHEDATYDDGVSIKARDFMMMVYVYVSNFVTSPYYKQYFREEFAQWTVFDDHTLAVTFPEPKSEREMVHLLETYDPAPPHFYKDYGPDYEERYQWKVAPTSGPYFVKPEDIVKGESIVLRRRKEWWAEDKKYYRYRFNPDRLVYQVVRERSKAFELLRAGELDMFLIADQQEWFEKSEIPPVFKGYLEKYQWYNNYPRPPWGMYLNKDVPLLKQKDIRLGIHHALNWDKVIDVVFWGDFSRLPGFVDGYGDWVNKEIKPRPFSPQKARGYFAKAGYSTEGEDGILRNAEGKRLEVTFSYRNDKSYYSQLAALLKQEAKAAGIDIILDELEKSVSFQRQQRKQHEIVLTARRVTPPFFNYYSYLHSKNAYDEKGNLKHNTNNVFSYANPEVDRLCELFRATPDEKEKRMAGLEIQKSIYDDAIFVPGWKQDFQRIVCWRWVRGPNCDDVNFAPPIFYYPRDAYTFWIDEEMKEETLKAMREGRTFPEVENIVEDYRE